MGGWADHGGEVAMAKWGRAIPQRSQRSLGQKSPPMLTPAGVLSNFIKNHWGEGEKNWVIRRCVYTTDSMDKIDN